MIPLTRSQQANEIFRSRLAEAEMSANALRKGVATLQAKVNKMDPVTFMLPVEITALVFKLYVSIH